MSAQHEIDIEKHAEGAAKQFAQLRGKYESFAEKIRGIISDSFQDSPICRIHNIEHRAKDVESFRKKSRKEKSEGIPKYSNPIGEITDLAGVRVILFFPDDIAKICQFIEENFRPEEKRDVGEERFAQSGSFGYASVHYLVKLKDDRLKFPDFAAYRDMVCEIQVRTILQHAWAEMEHDIQYKSTQSLPVEIRRKFMALAGMLEIADREFQSIQHEDERLRLSIKKSLEEQLTREGISTLAADGGASQTEPAASGSAGSADAGPIIGRARDLVIAGNFERAVQAYSQRIEAEPEAHTLYLGRAKARFLAGDHAGALEDIETAKTLNPNDAAIALLRNQIESGNMPSPVAANTENAANSTRLATDALARGDGKAAFDLFTEAQKAGYNFAFSIFNIAMSLALARDTVGARQVLAEQKPVPGTPMQINLTALNAILDLIDGKDAGESLERLKAKMDAMPDFTFDLSPLRHLEKGLHARKEAGPSGIDQVFSILRRPKNG